MARRPPVSNMKNKSFIIVNKNRRKSKPDPNKANPLLKNIHPNWFKCKNDAGLPSPDKKFRFDGEDPSLFCNTFNLCQS